ncbi:MarR family transcriptional regulator [Kineococcus sp. NUM-3379]
MAAPSGPVSTSSDAEAAMFEFVDTYDRAYEAAAGELGLSVAHACVLGRISGPRQMGSLAEELQCDPSNVTQIVQRLEARGLVRRDQDPADRRARLVARTTAGEALNGRFEERFSFPRHVTARLSDREQRQLASLLRKAVGAAAHPTPGSAPEATGPVSPRA